MQKFISLRKIREISFRDRLSDLKPGDGERDMQDQIFQVKIRKMQIVLPVEIDDDRLIRSRFT